PAVVSLRNNIYASPESSFRRNQAHVSVKLKDGRSYEKKIEGAIGSLDNPLSDEQIGEKFKVLAEGILPAEVTRKVIDLCWDLERLDDFSVIPTATRTAQNLKHA